MSSRLLGGLTPRDFLRRYWQKRPLLIRGAIPRSDAIVTRKALAALAARDDVESRIVQRRGTRRETRHGPFRKLALAEKNSTVLVNGVNLHVPAADALLQRFNFIPQARLDDVMVSYATPGGGVGPHVDRYDVFLVQGPGWGRCRVEYRRSVVASGDIVLLTLRVRHAGVALVNCFTYSFGLRATRVSELGAAFLEWLRERGLPAAD